MSIDLSFREINSKNLDALIHESIIPIAVEYWSSWCLPCKSMEHTLKALSEEFYGKILILKINSDINRQSTEKYNIYGLPTIIVFKNGVEAERLVGAQTYDMLKNKFMSVII